MMGAPLVILLGGLVGQTLAPTPVLATLPVSTLIIGTALATLPGALAMGRFGRKVIFLTGSGVSAAACLCAMVAIQEQMFWLFCLATAGIGVNIALVQQYRFAAIESVAAANASKAVSFLLVSGIAVAFLAPEIAMQTKGVFEQVFAGSFLAMTLVSLAGFVALCFYQNVSVGDKTTQGKPRHWWVVAKAPVFWVAVLCGVVGYGVMSYIMTATPLSMRHHEFLLSDVKWVIQSHLLAMFAPSLVTPWLIKRFGLLSVLFAGLVAMLMCVVVALFEPRLLHYWLALVLLGVGWNFLFVGGTALLATSYHEPERFRMQAINDFSIFGMQAIASLFAGVALTKTSWLILNVSVLPVLVLLAAGLLVLSVRGDP